MNFSQFLTLSAHRYPDKTALVVGQRRLTYHQMEDRAERLAGALSAMGFTQGDRLALAACNCLEYPEIVFACARLGVAAVLLNWRLNTQTLLGLLKRNEVKGVILQLGTHEAELELEAALAGQMPIFHLSACASGRKYDELLALDKLPSSTACLPENQVLMHIHTSGTTGLPKPVLYTHGSFSKELLSYLYQMEVNNRTVCQQMTQMFHSACVGMFGCLAAGGTIIALDHFDLEEYLETIQREKATRLALIPSILFQIVHDPRTQNYDLSSVREVAYSTAPMPTRLINQAMKVIPCQYFTTYGMTEMGPIVTSMGPKEHMDETLRGSVGRPIVGCDVRIEGADGSPCPAGVTGEIVVRGFGMMTGYLNMPEETNRAIRDGWFYTGDMGYLNDQGYLFLQGRKDNMIITGGENVYPAEIQNVLQALYDDVLEAVVYGLPDDLWGEAVVASVILNPGSTVTEEALRQKCRKHLAGYQVPKHIFFETAFPRNQVGKVLVKELVARHSPR